jgi:O-antigen ligase
LWIWVTWLGYVILSALHGYEFGWQSTAQIVCPVISGVAASTYRFSSADIDALIRLVRCAFWAYFAGVLVLVAPTSISDIAFSGFAGGAISALFFEVVFLANYVLNGSKLRDLAAYLLAVSVPIVSGNRGPLAASLGLLILAIMPIRLRRRALLLSLATAVGLIAFYSPKMQQKMFFSGQGTLSDLRFDNRDLNTNGRGELWTVLMSGMDQESWLGHGGNADRTWLLNHGLTEYLPHNDWLRIRFNYGILGTLLYILSIAVQIYHIRPLIRSGDPRLKVLASSAASCFIPYVLVMFTDNVMIYCQAYTVPMMILVGASYAATQPLSAIHGSLGRS